MRPSPYRSGYQQAIADAVSADEAAKQAGLSEQLFRLRAREGELPTARRIGRDWVYWPADLDAIRDRPDGRTVTGKRIVPANLRYIDPDEDWFGPGGLMTPPMIEIPRMSGAEIAAERLAYGLSQEDLLAAIEDATGEEVPGGVETVAAWEADAALPTVEQTWVIGHLYLLGYSRIVDRLTQAIDILYEMVPDARDDPEAFAAAMDVIHRVQALRSKVGGRS